MRFTEWIKTQIPEKYPTKEAFKAAFSKSSGLSRYTLEVVMLGALVKKYDTAKAISQATDGAVSITELCE